MYTHTYKFEANQSRLKNRAIWYPNHCKVLHKLMEHGYPYSYCIDSRGQMSKFAKKRKSNKITQNSSC